MVEIKGVTGEKTCFKCNKLLPLNSFYKHPKMPDGRVNKCKECNKLDTQLNYRKNIDNYKLYEQKRSKLKHRRELSKKVVNNWRKNNRGHSMFLTAKRRAMKRNATPKWANLEVIKEFYKNCPKGLTVDHIIPLQNELVCELHVEGNLQYLTKPQNSSKGNKFEIEFVSNFSHHVK